MSGKLTAKEIAAARARAAALPQRDYVYTQTRAWSSLKDGSGVHIFKLRMTAAEAYDDYVKLKLVAVVSETGKPPGMKNPQKPLKDVCLYNIPALISRGLLVPL